MTAPRPRIVVLGLDGLPFSLARSLCRQGHLPNLAGLALSDLALPIRAELPELSPVNWTSFFTGEGPERHGVFGFTHIDPHSYALSMTDATRVAVPTIFDRLGSRGLVCKVVNLPGTYPARPLKGMLVAGFVAPDLEGAVYPPFLLGPLRGIGYQLEADTHRGGSDPEFLLQDLRRTLDSRRRALELFWPDLAWDLFVLVLTETDRLGHFLFPALSSEKEPLHTACLDLLRHWDRLVGEVLDRYQALPEPKRLVVLADHGFAPLTVEVDLNAWLREQGLLHLNGQPRDEWDAGHIAPRTRAFALDPGRIHLHTRGGFARGGVGPAEAADLRKRLPSMLMDLHYRGEPVLERVWLREELYPEPCHPAAPDLVCQARPGFDLKGKFDRGEVFGHFGRRGCHTAGDAFFYDSLGARPSRLRDVGRLVLGHLDTRGLLLRPGKTDTP